jgi:CD63 antigen
MATIETGGMKCIKYLLFAFNLIFAITGLSLIITGCVIQGVYSNYLDFLGDSFFNTPVLLVVVGCIIFFVTFFGCCGAIKEHHCMTLAFSVFLSLILIIELGAGIASYAFRNQVGGIIESNMEKGLMNYGKDGYKGVTETWNIVQHELKCCGAQEYKDWTNTTFSESSNSVPDSCCLSDVEGCGNGILVKPDEEVPKIIYTAGCLGKLKHVIEHNVAALGGIGVGIAIIQFAGIIFACVLAATIRKGYETV